MKKKLVAVLIVALIVITTGCSNKEELALGKYIAEEGRPGDVAWVSLLEDNEFVFNRGSATSHRPMGNYHIEDEKLILTGHSDDVYVFEIDGDNLIFASGELAERLVEIGTIFKLDKED
jgi:hypothetical protein